MAEKNYMTPRGAEQLSAELKRLAEIERPAIVQEVADAAAQGDRSENAEYIYGKKRLREIDSRLRYLTRRLDAAVVVNPAEQSGNRVYFGAWVVVEDEEGTRQRYQLVGEDETDPSRGRISWRSPIGRALMRRSVGDVTTVQRPAGDVDLEIIDVSYAER